VKYYLAVIIRIANLLLNAGTGMVLAHSLSVNDRGLAAAILSITGGTVMLCAAVQSERLLKNEKNESKNYIVEIKLLRILTFCMISGLLIQNSMGKSSVPLVLISVTIIVLGILNTIFNAVAYNRNHVVMNQAFLFILTFLYFFLLCIFSLIYRNSLLYFLMALTIANFATLIFFTVYFKNGRIRINISISPSFRKASSSRGLKSETIAVFSANMSMQILIAGLSQFISPYSLAQVAILLSLFSIIGIPLAPVLPNLIASSTEYIKRLMNRNWKRFVSTLIQVLIYGLSMSLLIEMLFPFFFGVKYVEIASEVPKVVLAALSFTGNQYLSWLSRGLEMYWLSATLNLVPVLIILLYSLLFQFSVGVFFICLSISYSLSILFGYKMLENKFSYLR
jgi:hypothetical protein